MRSNKIAILCFTLMGTVTGAGCGDFEIEEGSTHAGSSHGDDVQDEDTTILDRIVRLQRRDLEGIKYGSGTSDDITITFPNATQTVRDLEVGQIIVASEQEHTFIREILTLQRRNNGRTVWMWTTALPLSQVLSSNHRERFRVNPASIKAFFKNADKSIYRDLNLRIQCADCNFRVDPDFAVDFQLSGGRLRRFSTTVGARISGKFIISVAGTPRTLQHSKTIPLYNRKFIQHIGPVPIWEDVSLTALVNVWLGKGKEDVKLISGFKTERKSSSTLTFAGGRWTRSQQSHSSFDWIHEGNAYGGRSKISMRSRLELRLEVQVYSLAGVRVDAGLQGDYSFQGCPAPGAWDVTGDLFVDLHSGVPFSGGYLFDEKRNLFQMGLKKHGTLGSQSCRP